MWLSNLTVIIFALVTPLFVPTPCSRVTNTFHAYEVLPAEPGWYPAPSEALKLLYRLASDPGIMAVMEAHHLEVGTLAEMPPNIGECLLSVLCVEVATRSTPDGQCALVLLKRSSAPNTACLTQSLYASP